MSAKDVDCNIQMDGGGYSTDREVSVPTRAVRQKTGIGEIGREDTRYVREGIEGNRYIGDTRLQDGFINECRAEDGYIDEDGYNGDGKDAGHISGDSPKDNEYVDESYRADGFNTECMGDFARSEQDLCEYVRRTP